MRLTEAQKNQVRKDLIDLQKYNLLIQQAALVPSYLREYAKIQMRITESLAIQADIFIIEGEQNGG